jgi:hypothetical protein
MFEIVVGKKTFYDKLFRKFFGTCIFETVVGKTHFMTSYFVNFSVHVFLKL